MTVEQIRELINQNADSQYREFHSKLLPGTDSIIGVRVPILRSIAKEIIKSNNYHNFIESHETRSYEETTVRGIAIGLLGRQNPDYIIELTRKFVPQIDNWATCDIFCGGLKIAAKHQSLFHPMLENYLRSESEFEQRFAIVMLMNYYTDQHYINSTLGHLSKHNSTQYYVRMAIAWAISLCFIRNREATLAVLEDNQLDNFTHNKAIQKICESFRVPSSDKELVRRLKH